MEIQSLLAQRAYLTAPPADPEASRAAPDADSPRAEAEDRPEGETAEGEPATPPRPIAAYSAAGRIVAEAPVRAGISILA